MSATFPAACESRDVEGLFREYHVMVFRTAYHVTGSVADAEDVLQTVFLRLVRREAGALEKAENYLRRSAVNAALDVVRSRRSARAVPLAGLDAILPSDPKHSPESGSAAAQMREWMRKEVAAMSPRSAEMFALRYFEGLDNREIARLFDTSNEVVAVTLHRVRERLERQFRERFGERS